MVEGKCKLAPESAHPEGRHLQKAEHGVVALGEDVRGARDGVGRALGRRRRVDLGQIDRRVEHEVRIALAIGLSDRTHQIVVREIETAGEDGRQ
jgi:hypothetical protein